MSFGLTNAPAGFMDMLNRVFASYIDQFFIVFIVDILIYSRNKEEHEEHLKLALRRLKEHQLFAKYYKSEFWLDIVIFPDHIISKDEVMVDPHKISAITE